MHEKPWFKTIAAFFLGVFVYNSLKNGFTIGVVKTCVNVVFVCGRHPLSHRRYFTWKRVHELSNGAHPNYSERRRLDYALVLAQRHERLQCNGAAAQIFHFQHVHCGLGAYFVHDQPKVRGQIVGWAAVVRRGGTSRPVRRAFNSAFHAFGSANTWPTTCSCSKRAV